MLSNSTIFNIAVKVKITNYISSNYIANILRANIVADPKVPEECFLQDHLNIIEASQKETNCVTAYNYLDIAKGTKCFEFIRTLFWSNFTRK